MLVGGALVLTGCGAHHVPPSPVAGSAHTAPTATISPVTGRPFPTSKTDVSLFDGKTLTGWRVTDFAGTGGVRAEDGWIILER